MSEHDEPSLIEQIRTERAALQADMARRREQIKREETLAWVEARKGCTCAAFAACRPRPAPIGSAATRHDRRAG